MTSAVRQLLLGKRQMTANQAIAAAARRRVDLVLISDSNAQFGGYGWFGGLQKKLGALYGNYAGPVNGLGTTAPGSLPVATWAGVAGAAATTGAPSGLTSLFPGGTVHNYFYLAGGSTVSASSAGFSTVLNVAGGVDIAAPLRSHLVWGTFDSGTGSFRMTTRLGYSPFSSLANSGDISTNAGAFSLRRTTVTIAQDASRTGASVESAIARATTLTGPFFGVFHRMENIAAKTGLCVSRLTSTAGWTMYDMANDLQNTADATLTQFFSEVRYLQQIQGLAPMVVIAVNAGMNDRNATTFPSLGPNPQSDPKSAAAYIDNWNAIVIRIRQVWDLNGWDKGELYWQLFPSHPVSSPDDSALISYRDAAKAWARENAQASAFNFTDYIDSTTMTSAGYYDSGGNAHLTIPGYDALSTFMGTAISQGA